MDIISPRKQNPHEHRWMFLTTKGSYVPADTVNNQPVYQFIDYAILICNGCTKVIKRQIINGDEVIDEEA